MGVPPWELLKLPLSLCNAGRRVSIDASQKTAGNKPAVFVLSGSRTCPAFRRVQKSAAAESETDLREA